MATRRAAVLDLLASLRAAAIDATVLGRAAQPMPTALGTLDAIHLATVLRWRETEGVELVMATHDRELAIAAHGLPVVGVSLS